MTTNNAQLVFLQVFLEEVAEVLQSVETALLALEKNQFEDESLNAVFRAMHTIKGAAAAFGYTPVVNFTHRVETLMDAVRSGQMVLTPALIKTLFECCDHIAHMIEVITDDDALLNTDLQHTGEILLARLYSASPIPTNDQNAIQPLIESPPIYTRYLDLLALPVHEQVDCFGDLLVSIGALTPAELAQAVQTQRNSLATRTTDCAISTQQLGEIRVEPSSVKANVLENTMKTQENVRAKRQEETRVIRVDAQRLGHLIDLVGELVTSSAAIRVMVKRAGIDNMTEVVDGVDYLVSEIRDNALQLRMVAIGESLSRFRRVVRDVSQELGKSIELIITGGETELDKTVVEKITDPLTHLIRNAVDHGIEMPAIRQAAGKLTTGTIHLNAYHDSGHIVIEINDDGAGLDAALIRAKAELKGLIKPEDVLTHEEILRLIFAPGLSTKDQATNLSGRGVGMDVVRRNIEALRGTVELESQFGIGTKITIILPLTLAIIEGFLVGAGRDQYVIPLSQVAECVEMNVNETRKHRGEHYINLRGEVLPFIRLTDLFENADSTRTANQRESLVVVRFGHHKMGLVVDTLLGELQTVIKPLGKLFERLRGVAGATILGTGDIALILDVAELATISHSNVVIKNSS
ncbi:chemotaxis protein CheA [Chromatium weissei]|nr:chemotaxis protein CheA [Chromatium weissei]